AASSKVSSGGGVRFLPKLLGFPDCKGICLFYNRTIDSNRKVKCRFFRTHHPRYPKRTTQSTGPGSWTRKCLPPLINGKRKIRIDKDIAIVVAHPRPLYAHHLVPAVHTSDGIGMHWKSQVLMDAGIAPPHPLRVWVGRLIGLHARSLTHLPLSLADFLQIDPCARHAFQLIFLPSTPPSHVVRAGNHPGRQSFGHPCVQHKKSDLRVYLDQIAGAKVP